MTAPVEPMYILCALEDESVVQMSTGSMVEDGARAREGSQGEGGKE